ncbi:MAG: DUF58 domain-containing protein [Candidatus Hydrogenedentes bacterium]|nr:DUF58 domain-containing protein [Candidatus Hydrogenedentota bacterium]
MKRRGPSDFERFARYLLQYKLTSAGRSLIVLGLVAGLLGYTLELPIFYTLCSLFALGFTALVVNSALRPRLTISGSFPQLACAGQAVTGWFRVGNTGRWSILELDASLIGIGRSLRVIDSRGARTQLAPGAHASLPITIMPNRRGLYRLPPVRVFTTFPFSICRSGRSAPLGGPLLVAPRFHPLASIDVPASRRHQPGGISLTSDVGESPEYIGNREYRAGDPPRRIDFRSWARLARPVVREYQEEFYCRIALVLDTYVPGRRWRPATGFPEFEAAVSMAAAIADALARGEYLIDIFAAGPELYVFRSGRSIAHFENVLEILACVDECRTNPFDTIAPALTDELARISTVICVFLDWDETRERLVRAAVDSGCAVKVIIVRDSATTAPISRADAIANTPALVFSSADVTAGAIDSL